MAPNSLPKPGLVFGLMALSLVLGCSVPSMPEPDEGAGLYGDNCAMCHGAAGRGDGPLAQDLKQPPADLTRLSAQNGGRFPQVRVLSAIDGYTRMENPDENMPEFGLLLRGDPVPLALEEGGFSPVPRPLAALVIYLESLQEG